MSRPEPDPSWSIPSDHHFVVAASPNWRLLESSSGKLCRSQGARHKFCRQPAVAEINRGKYARGRGLIDSWWAYCPDHMYGNWIEDGQVMHWEVRKTEVIP